jgi:hypothetical protein
MGSTATALGFNFDLMVNEITARRIIHAVMKEVSNALTARGKQWVFVFDQINKLFTKPQNAKHATDLLSPSPLLKERYGEVESLALFRLRQATKLRTRTIMKDSISTSTLQI